MAPPAKRQKIDGAPRRALTRRAQNGSSGPGRHAANAAHEQTDVDYNAHREGGSQTSDSESDVEDTPLASAAPYNALLQSLGAAQHPAKTKNRRADQSRQYHQAQRAPHDDGGSDFSVEDEDIEEEAAHAEEDIIDPYAVVDEDDAADPFEIHFANPDENELTERLAAVTKGQWKKEEATLKGFGKLTAMVPDIAATNGAFVHQGLVPLSEMKLKKRWVEPAAKVQKELDPKLQALTPVMFNYADVLFGGRTVENARDLRQLSCLHALNHVFKTRDKVLKNTAKIARDAEASKEYRDQGFTRPKVLFLLETRQSCVRYMDAITRLAEPEQQENRKRFLDAFSRPEDDFSEDRPADFRELFSGNDDNDFRLGVKFTRKTMKYFSQFYSSDIILASPLGLRRAMKLDDTKKADCDFLSSIEMVIVDQADAMLMQNWDHVEHVFEHLNQQPKQAHGCDFSRVRRWYLDGQASHLRQTIVFSAYLTPELNGLFSAHMRNVTGKVRVLQQHEGAILDAATVAGATNIRQTFTRFAARTPAVEPDARFKHFTTVVLPSLARDAAVVEDPTADPLGALVYIPSYLDFVRVRNHLAGAPAAQQLSFGAICEYTPVAEVRRARAHFAAGRHSVLLYTGRAHHFRRWRLRGVRSVVLYGLPESPAHYVEIVGGFLGASSGGQQGAGGEVRRARILFSRWDALALERVAGSARAGRMLGRGGSGMQHEGDTFDFC